MEQTFEIPVHYKQKDLLIPAGLQVQGYTYRIEAMINEVLIYFEKDDSGEFRALLPPETPATARLPEHGLIEAVAASLTVLLA